MVFFNGQFYVWVIASQKDSKISGWFYFLQMCVYLNISYTSAFIGGTMYFFHFNDIYIFIYENTAEMGPPTGHPSICFMKLLLTENTHSVVHFNNNFLVRR